MSSKTPVLVLGCHVSGLAVIRALGLKGIESIGLKYERTDFADVSRYVREVVAVPHPRTEEARFVDLLHSKRCDWAGALIIDTDDNGAVALSKHKDELSRHYRIVTAEWDVMRRFLEKKEAYKLAEEAGVPHPKNFAPKSMEELREVVGQMEYPCILKPVRGHEFVARFGMKNFIVESEREALERFELCLQERQDVMLQEAITGPETNLYKMQTYMNSKGFLSAKFFWNKIRQHPPMFGVARVGISSERNEDVERLSEQLLRTSHYSGYCSFEFKKDLRDKQLKLMEVNVRMPRNGLLAVASGVNFPWIIYKDLVEDQQVTVDDYTKNLYWIETGLDVYYAIFRHKKERFTIKEYLRPYLSKHKAFAVWSMHDVKPFLKHLVILFLRLFERGTRRKRR